MTEIIFLFLTIIFISCDDMIYTYPTDHISIGVLYSLSLSSNSGALYQSVTTIGVYCLNGEPYSRAKPKSPTFKMPLWLNSKLDVFKSRCNIQLSCRCATASNNCCIRHLISPTTDSNIKYFKFNIYMHSYYSQFMSVKIIFFLIL